MKMKFEFEYDGIEKVTVTSKGTDLKIEGWDEEAIKATNVRALRNDGELVLLADDGESILKVPSDAPLSLRVLGGDVEASNCRISEIILNGGDALLNSIKLGTAKVIGGDLKVAFREIDGDVSITVNNGDIMLFLEEDFDVDVKFKAINGSLKLVGLSKEEIQGGMFEINVFLINGDLIIHRGEYENEKLGSRLHLNEGTSYIAAGKDWAEIRIDEMRISAENGKVTIDTGSGKHEVTNPDAFNLIVHGVREIIENYSDDKKRAVKELENLIDDFMEYIG
ncbi:DUF4097 family beta strand repeat-containing protein [Thermococcus sp.]